MRADFAMSGRSDQYASNVAASTDGSNVVGGYRYMGIVNVQQTASASGFGPVSGNSYALGSTVSSGNTLTGYVAANGIAKSAAHLYGWEARGRVELDARTPTAYGTVQTVFALRMARTTGVLSETGPNLSASGAGATLEAAYIRFAGFTFGASRDNFSFMPSVFYGAGHWSSFANGAKQLAYTAVLGGGFSVTLAVQDVADTTAGGVNALGTVASANGFTGGITAGDGFLVAPEATAVDGAGSGTIAYAYKNLPQINGRIDFEQAWGGISVMGAVGQAVAVNSSANYDKSKTTWAAGAGARINLPMIAAGDTLWLNAAYAEGMTEYTTNWTSFKSSDTRRNVGGYVTNHPSWINTSGGIELMKSWQAAAVFQHFWTPQWRQAFLVSGGAIDSTATAKSLAWSQTGAFGDAKVWNVGTQLAWLPTRNFEIGVDVLYARVEQDIRRIDGTTTNNAVGTAVSATSVTREKAGNWTGRLRVERTF